MIDVTDALRVKLQLREQDVTRLTERNNHLENDRKRVEQHNLRRPAKLPPLPWQERQEG